MQIAVALRPRKAQPLSPGALSCRELCEVNKRRGEKPRLQTSADQGHTGNARLPSSRAGGR